MQLPTKRLYELLAQYFLVCMFGLHACNIAGIQIFNEAPASEINRRGNLDIKTGKLIFHSKNCHIYKRQFKMVEELLKPGEDSRRKALQPKQA